jgi:methylmalonyl-CoA/ethylmalonyl-CoA epimerase
MLTGLDHIGIAVSDLEAAIMTWVTATGGRVTHREIVAEQRVEVAAIKIGSLCIELLSPTSSDSPIAKFLATRGPGIHHLALTTTSAAQELERLKSAGIRLIDEVPRTGAENTRIAFVHPKALGGVLLEIVEHPAK